MNWSVNTNEVDENAANGVGEVIPDKTELRVVVTDVTQKPTSTGGVMLVIEHTVIDGQYANRKIWQNMNIVNASEAAQNIGRAQMKKLLIAIGKDGLVVTPDNLQEFYAIPHTIKVKIKKGQNGYSDSNEVADWKPAAVGQPQAAQQQYQPALNQPQQQYQQPAPTQPQQYQPAAGPWAQN